MHAFENGKKSNPALPLFVLAISAALFAAIPAAFARPIESLTIDSPSGTRAYPLKELIQSLPTVVVEIDDPVYGKKKTFDGWDLNHVLAHAGITLDQATNYDEIVFQAKDGYAPSVPVSLLKGKQAVLVYQEHTGAKGKPRLRPSAERFGKVHQGKALVSPAPLYLVWSDGKKVGEQYPWPYQLVRIELVEFRKKFAKLYPADATETLDEGSSLKNGFIHFKTHCLRCHSVNLQGGDIGPELNVPKNITEYWEEKTLREFIANAESFRMRSKMPSFQGVLDKRAIEDIIVYLKEMKDRKQAL